MKIDENYDVVISGASLGPLVAGITLARKGFKTLCVYENRNPSISQFSSLRPMIGFSENQFAANLFKKLEIPLPVLQCRKNPFQILFGNAENGDRVGDLNISNQWSDEFIWEINREIPDAPDSVFNFFKNVISLRNDIEEYLNDILTAPEKTQNVEASLEALLGSRFKVDLSMNVLSAARKLEFPEKVVSFLLSGPAMLGPYIPEKTTFKEAIFSTALLMMGNGTTLGGWKELESILKKSLQDNGGHIKKNAKIDQVLKDGEKLNGVLLSSFEGKVNTKALIMGSEIRNSHIDDGSYLCAGISVKIPRALVSESLGEHLFWIGNPYLGSREGNYIRISNQVIQTEKLEESQINIATIISKKDLSKDSNLLRRLENQLFEKLFSIFPYANPEELRAENISNFDMDMELDSFIDPEILSIRKNHVWDSGEETVFPVDEFVYPGLGETGEMLSGILAAEKIVKKVKNI